MQALEVHNLRKEFVRRDGRGKRRVAALKGLDFTIERGECVAILGPNGSGKSTLVRLLSTLLLPDGGDARVFGHDAFRETRVVRRLVNRVSVEASFFKQEVQQFIREVRAEHDATVLLCTHDLAEAESLADRVGILDGGALLCLEPAEELKARYNAETLEEAFFAASGHAFENGEGGDHK